MLWVAQPYQISNNICSDRSGRAVTLSQPAQAAALKDTDLGERRKNEGTWDENYENVEFGQLTGCK